MIINWIVVIVLSSLFILVAVVNAKFRFSVNGFKGDGLMWFVEWLILNLIISAREVGGIRLSGADTEVYVEAFLNRDKQDFEPLFNIINDLLRTVTDNYHVYFFVIYGFMIVCFICFVRAFFLDRIDIASLLFCFCIYFHMFNLLRQWFAVSFGLLALALWRHKRRILPIVICIVSVFIHKSMAVYVGAFILCYVASKFRIRPNYKVLLFVALLINLGCFLSRDAFIEYISNTGYKAYVAKEMLEAVSWFGYIPTIMFLIVIMWYGEKIEGINGGDDYIKYILIFGFVNLSIMYVNTGLGMWRLTQILLPIRICLAYLFVQMFIKRFAWGECRHEKMRYLISIPVTMTAIRYLYSGIRYMNF